MAKRTRQVLKEGFIEMMREKGFASVSIKDIADRAEVNRGTFYIHYPDKYKLLDEIVRERFMNHLRAALPTNLKWDRDTFSVIVRTVLHYFETKYRHRPPSSRFPADQVEKVIFQELARFLEKLILSELNADTDKANKLQIKIRAVCRFICREAIHWSREPVQLSLDEEAEVIVSVIAGGIPFA